MTDRYLSSVRSDDRGQSSSNPTFRVEPSSVPVFITKLCLILDDNALRDMITWSNDGQRFSVFDIPGFSKVVLPQYFKHSNWPSFVRQLNMYGFHKVNGNLSARHEQLICEFHHPMFYRNGRLALRKIRRNSRKSVSATVDTQALHQTQRPSSQHQQPHQHQHRHHHHHHHDQQEQQQHHDRRYQQQSPPSYRRDSSVASTSLPTSGMPVSSLLSSNDNDYADDSTIPFLNSTANNDTLGTDAMDDYHNSDRKPINSKNRISDDSNDRSIIGRKNNTININNKNSTDTNINLGSNFGCGEHINKNKGKCTADIGYDYGDSQSNEKDGPNLMAPLAEQYTEIRQQLDQLQSNTASLNSEMAFLKRYVARQQESVIDLLNYLSAITEDSDHPGFKNRQQHQQAMKAFRVRSEQECLDPANDKRSNTSDNNEKSSPFHHHHPYYHDYHHHNHKDNNGKSDGLDDVTYLDDNNPTKTGIRNTIHKPKQSTEPAKKDHHMHIHPLDNRGSTTSRLLTLDNNQNNTHLGNYDGSQSNSNYSYNNGDGTSTSTSIKSPISTTSKLTSPTISHASKND